MGLRRYLKNFLYKKKYEINELNITNIKNKNIFVTGANSGIGNSLVRELLILNNKVFATYKLNFDNLRKINNKNLTLIKCDNQNFQEIEMLKNVVINKPINIIINNVGIWGQEKQDNIENIRCEDFVNTSIINAISIVKIVNIILKNSEKNSLKIIMNISSGGGSITNNTAGNAYVYRATKAMLNSITKTMSIDLFNRFEIISFAIDPGNVQTSMNKNGLLKSDDCAKHLINILDTCSKNENGKFMDLFKNNIPW